MRDINHTIRLSYLRTKRGYRDHAAPHLVDFWNGLVDTTNSGARAGLGLLIVVFSLAADLLKRWQNNWYRKEKRPSVH